MKYYLFDGWFSTIVSLRMKNPPEKSEPLERKKTFIRVVPNTDFEAGSDSE